MAIEQIYSFGYNSAMDIRFEPNNTHLENASDFARLDPHLKRLYAETYIYHSPLIKAFPRKTPGIFTLGGGRQIGKSTLLKQWMESLIQTGIDPKAICFFSGELIGDHQSLYQLIQTQLADMPKNTIKYFIVDEITDVSGWDKTIKYLADIGALENTALMLSGSDLSLMQDARMRFPGRRGRADTVDFHYYPLAFSEFMQLKHGIDHTSMLENNALPETLDLLYREFDRYLIHGGFLRAINDFEKLGTIPSSTLMTYSDWIRGDMLKRNKKEIFLKEITGAILKHYTKQISWDNLVKELSIDHTQTVADYINQLESMDAVFVQSAIIEDKLLAAPKKRKKVIYCDPFIYHAMRAWFKPEKQAFENQIKPIFEDPERYSQLVESTVIAHYRRFFPTYYIKAEGEVDIAYVSNNKFFPVEIKWTQQLRPKDLKQISKYKNGIILAKTHRASNIHHIPITPLPIALLQLREHSSSLTKT